MMVCGVSSSSNALHTSRFARFVKPVKGEAVSVDNFETRFHNPLLGAISVLGEHLVVAAPFFVIGLFRAAIGLFRLGAVFA